MLILQKLRIDGGDQNLGILGCQREEEELTNRHSVVLRNRKSWFSIAQEVEER